MSFSRFLRIFGAREILVLLLVSVVFLGLFFVTIGNRRADMKYSHTARSIEMAFNWTQCGEFSALREIGVQNRIAKRPNPLDTSLSELAAHGAEDISGYCDGSFNQFQNEDSSLFYLMSGVLFVNPNVSAMGIFWSLSGVMAVSLASFLMLLWRLTRDPYVTGASALMLVGLFATLALDQFLGIRVFMWPLFLLAVAVLVRAYGTDSYRALVFGTAGAGAIAAIGINLRSSYIVHYVLVLGIIIAANSIPKFRNPKIDVRVVISRVLGGLLAFFIGLFVVQTVFIGPISNLEVESGLSHHPFAYPLVGGLSVPESDLSKREGILWIDSVITALALRVDPAATTYQKQESALWKFYWGLWSDHPAEMIVIYARKFHQAGQYEMSFLRTRIVGYLSPASIINSGYFHIAFMVISSLAYLRFHRKRSHTLTILIYAVTGAALVDFAQAAVIVPNAVLYYPVLIFGLAFSTALIWSVAIDRLGIERRVRQRIRIIKAA